MAEFTGKPAYLHIADNLRAGILGGSLAGGDRIPSEATLMADYGVSRIVVRNAVDVLKSEGLVRKHQGSGTFVREQRPPIRRIVGDFYATRPDSSPFAAAAQAAGRTPEWGYQSRRTTATAVVAHRLAIEQGDDIMCTQYRFIADDEPIMLSTSYEPLVLTGGTAIEAPESGPAVGVVARMDAIGVPIDTVTEEVHARAARPFETETLLVPTGVPVMVIERTYFADGRPVETADIVVSADRYTLAYRVSRYLPGAGPATRPGEDVGTTGALPG
ncbi:MAG: GntR family transcriptional regulator [Dermatophilaceae bacterium]